MNKCFVNGLSRSNRIMKVGDPKGKVCVCVCMSTKKGAQVQNDGTPLKTKQKQAH